MKQKFCLEEWVKNHPPRVKDSLQGGWHKQLLGLGGNYVYTWGQVGLDNIFPSMSEIII